METLSYIHFFIGNHLLLYRSNRERRRERRRKRRRGKIWRERESTEVGGVRGRGGRGGGMESSKEGGKDEGASLLSVSKKIPALL